MPARPAAAPSVPAGVVYGTGRIDASGRVSDQAMSCLAIPAVLRRRCGLRAGDQVLLAAVPDRETLVACSFAMVDQASRAHGAFPHASGGQPRQPRTWPYPSRPSPTPRC